MPTPSSTNLLPSAGKARRKTAPQPAPERGKSTPKSCSPTSSRVRKKHSEKLLPNKLPSAEKALRKSAPQQAPRLSKRPSIINPTPPLTQCVWKPRRPPSRASSRRPRGPTRCGGMRPRTRPGRAACLTRSRNALRPARASPASGATTLPSSSAAASGGGLSRSRCPAKSRPGRTTRCCVSPAVARRLGARTSSGTRRAATPCGRTLPARRRRRLSY